MSDRLNVLVVMADEQSWNTLGCTGNPAARTPNLDALAGESTVFDACYTPFPLCCPARTSLWTGLMPRHHGVLGNWRPIEPQLRSAGVAQAFAAAGYHTHYNGKWHVPGTTPAQMGWADSSAIPAVLRGQDRGRYIEDYRTWAANRGYAFDPDHIENLTTDDLVALSKEPYATSSVPLDSFLETWQCDTFLDGLDRRPADKPWLAVCSMNAPHFPMLVPSPYDRLIDRDRVRLPASWSTGTATKPREVRDSHFARDFEHLSEQEWIEVTSHYLGLCALVDTQFGRIRQYLEDAGEWDRTVVVFTSDHGDLMGAHRLMEKGHFLHYEEDLRVPLIVRHPDGRQSRNANFVSLVDVAATISELAGVTWDEQHDGRSFAAMVGNDTAAPIREYVTAETMLHDGHPGGNGDPFHAKDWQYPRDSLNLSVRTADHRYIFRSHDEAELYDLATDPWEQRNLASTAEGASTAALLAGLLADEVCDVLPEAAALVRKSVPADTPASKG
ncbi:sulfatase-like hydrolase/transferase [Kribbella sp. NPDC000426]|uniref:sulfatase-like hydrolase/transferase n=1 Tax=Kribbella sp. NPDC000426 TaxID=3154255 RepID=UPI00332F899D